MGDEAQPITLEGLLDSMFSGDDQSVQENCLQIGLILEKETAHDPAQFDKDIRTILGEDFAYVPPTSAEIDRAIRELIDYIEHNEYPEAGAVWALARCRSRRMIRPLVRLLKRTMTGNDPKQAHIANEALYGVALFQDKIALSTIKVVIKQGAEPIKECATAYLAVQGKTHRRRSSKH